MSEIKPLPGDATSRKSWISGANDIPATKQFVVNATGNIFVATTLSSHENLNSGISEEAKRAFSQVSIYFAALTKAMAEENKSIFNYKTMDNVIRKSGFFIEISKSEIDFKSQKWGVEFSNQLIQSLLGFSGNLAALGKSLQSMLIGAGKESINLSASSDETETRVGSLIFILEYLLGAVSITPVLLSVDKEEVNRALEVGPCFKAHQGSVEMIVEKTMYLFVPPEFVEQAATLNAAMNNSAFDSLVEAIRDDINQG